MSKTKIDWLRAEQDYLNDTRLSLMDISKKYKVGYSRMKKISMEKGWHQKRKNLIEKGKEQIEKEAEKSLAEQIKQHKKDIVYIKRVALEEIKKRVEGGFLRNESLSVLVRMIDISLREAREILPINLFVKEAEVEAEADDSSPEFRAMVHKVINDVFKGRATRIDNTPEYKKKYKKQIQQLRKMAKEQGLTHY